MKRTKYNTEVARYLKGVKQRTKPSHAGNVERTLASLGKHLGRRELTRAVIVEWRDNMDSSPATIGQNIGIVKCFFRHLLESEVVDRNPADGIRVPRKVQVRPYRAFTDGELGAVLAAARTVDERLGRKWKGEWVLRALAETGMRVGALCDVQWGDVDTGEHPSITVRGETTKTGVGRKIPISRSYADELVEQHARHWNILAKEPGDHSPAFRSTKGFKIKRGSCIVAGLLHAAMKEAGIEKRDREGASLCVHSFRHTMCSRLLRSGASVAQTMFVLGHRSPTMTLSTYSRLNSEDARGAIDALPVLDSGLA